MNCAFLFYGKPCSGKDTFINLLLRKRKQLELFLYLFQHLVQKNESYIRLREKIFFIQLIKYYYRIGNRKRKVTISWNHVGETDRIVSFRFLNQLTRHLLRIWWTYGWDPGAGSKRGTKRAKNGREKEQLPCGAPPTGTTRQLVSNVRKVPHRNSLRRRTKLPNQSSNSRLICYLYSQKDKWMCHYRSYLRRNKIKTFNISLDYIEKQLYRGHPPRVTSLSLAKVGQKQFHLLLNRRYTVYGREKHHGGGVYYPIAQNQQSSNNPRGGMAEHVFILLNDTFHLPSMRKKYYLLCRRYHFNYAQIYLNAPLSMCLERNRRRKKFKPIADKTIVRNHFYHQKYAVRVRGAGQTRSPNRVTVVRGGRKWQKGVFSIQVDSSAPEKVCLEDARTYCDSSIAIWTNSEMKLEGTR
ncbi:hypothetical protein PCYB_022020 [Plasmodium cynomolgi strain B]|uniref:L-seryl-tRNA(Sec) kinase n=1 Tax=Plasmodium cynomolgi (strain B) TaxID=1120755 RepID=K6V6B1_PLACD|nr:hypothetical protein PCYB_022020 [Plasmodium cynomolgi strain B]GAB64632.1 hypothetical protein PCYB_022020 [Plasmodium cynomolgi strain B]